MIIQDITYCIMYANVFITLTHIDTFFYMLLRLFFTLREIPTVQSVLCKVALV